MVFYECLECIRLWINFLYVFSLYTLLLVLTTNITLFSEILFINILILVLFFTSTSLLIIVLTNSWLFWISLILLVNCSFIIMIKVLWDWIWGFGLLVGVFYLTEELFWFSEWLIRSFSFCSGSLIYKFLTHRIY